MNPDLWSFQMKEVEGKPKIVVAKKKNCGVCVVRLIDQDPERQYEQADRVQGPVRAVSRKNSSDDAKARGLIVGA